jgi:hypothetical protein
VRTAANAFLSAKNLPRASRRERLEKTARVITLQQHRAAKARKTHHQKARDKLKQLGVDFRKLRRCKLE